MSWKSFSVWHLFFRLDIFVVILEPSPPVKDYRFSVGQLPSWAQKQVGWFKTVLSCGVAPVTRVACVLVFITQINRTHSLVFVAGPWK